MGEEEWKSRQSRNLNSTLKLQKIYKFYIVTSLHAGEPQNCHAQLFREILNDSIATQTAPEHNGFFKSTRIPRDILEALVVHCAILFVKCLVKLNDGKAVRIVQEKIVETVGDRASVAETIVCQRRDGRQNWLDITVEANVPQLYHVNYQFDQFSSLHDIGRANVEQDELVAVHLGEIFRCLSNCLTRSAETALQDVIPLHHAKAKLRHRDIEEEIIADQNALVELGTTPINLEWKSSRWTSSNRIFLTSSVRRLVKNVKLDMVVLSLLSDCVLSCSTIKVFSSCSKSVDLKRFKGFSATLSCL